MKKIAKHFVPNPGTLLIVGLFLLAQSVAGSPSAPFLTQAPSATLISYQGRLADAGGNPLTGDYQMQFALYDVPAGGSACWSETQTVSVSDGLFNVLLGSVTAIDPSCLTGDVYLGIKVGNDSEMTPRELLASVPFATQALSLPNVNVVNGNVGIGTTSPGSKLDVRGGDLRVNGSLVFEDSAGVPLMDNWIGEYNDGTYDWLHIGGITSSGARRVGLWSDITYFRGNVGIGTMNPGPKLEVVANGHGIKSTTSAPNAWAGLFYNSNNGAEALLAGPSGIAARFLNGNVGIGTADPKSTLDVAGTLSVNDRINLIRNGYWAEIETDSAGGGSSNATRLYFYGYDASENRNQIAVFDGNSNVTFYGSVNAHGEVYTSRLNSPQDTDLMIDAGYQSHNNLSLNDDVSIPNGNLDMVDHQIKKVSRISSSGDLTIDAGDGPRRTLTLQDDVRIPDGTLKFKDNPGGGSGDYAQLRYYAENGENTRLELKVQNDGDDDIYLSASGPIYLDGSDAVVKSNLTVEGSDIALKGRNSGGTGNPGRALVDGSDRLYINFNNDFSGWEIGGPAKGNLDMGGRSIVNCGALVEANLQTPEELATEQVERFEQGDVLCWGDDQLEKCSLPGDRLVQAVADKNGKPIIIGAEVIKVLGPVKRGDLLVASSVPGYAIVNNGPAPGAVIAQALEGFAGEQGTIKAMIRKF